MKNKKPKFLINILIILIVLIIVLYFSLKDNYDEIITAILNMSPAWILLAMIFLCLYRILVGVSIYNIVKTNGEKISLLRSIQISFIILFFHGITPFAGGGQPMEIYYLHNEKIRVTKATNIVLQNFIVYQISLIIVSIFALLYNYKFELFPDNSLIKKLVVLGFLINLFVLVITYILSFGKKLNKFICVKGLNLIAKLKLIKNVEEKREKLNTYLSAFHSNALKLHKHKKQVILNIAINIIALASLFSIPYAVSNGLGVTNISVIESIVSTAYVMTIGSFIPIPGGTGGVEYGFIYFYDNLVNGSILNAIMLVWRFISYYLGIIIGAIALALYRKKVTK